MLYTSALLNWFSHTLKGKSSINNDISIVLLRLIFLDGFDGVVPQSHLNKDSIMAN